VIDAANPVQAAIYAALTADTGAGGLFGTPALINGVFDAAGVPEAQAMPYVTIGYFDSGPFRTFAKNGEDLQATLHVWTRTRGFKSGNAIGGRLKALLGDNSLTVAGYSLARSTFLRSNNVPDPQTDVEHIVITFRILLGET